MPVRNWGVYHNEDVADIIPHHDLIEHTYEDCACGPRTEPVKRVGGSVGWIYVHHSLDGREQYEHRD